MKLVLNNLDNNPIDFEHKIHLHIDREGKDMLVF